MKHSATQRKDRRVERTRAALFETLVKLIVEKGYDRTTVQDVLQEANVGRATFYAHFYNKKDLLLGRMSVFQLDVGYGKPRVCSGKSAGAVNTTAGGHNSEPMVRQAGADHTPAAAEDGSRGLPRMPDVTRLFEHVASQRRLYLALRGTEALEATLAIARADLLASFEKLFHNGRKTSTAGGVAGDRCDSHFLAQFFTGALIQLLISWLDRGMPETAETMNRWFAELGERVLSPALRPDLKCASQVI